MGGLREPRKCDGPVRKFGAASSPPRRDHSIASHETHYVEWNLQAECRCPHRRRGLADNRATRNKVGNGVTPGDHRAGDEARASRRPNLGRKRIRKEPHWSAGENEMGLPSSLIHGKVTLKGRQEVVSCSRRGVHRRGCRAGG